MNRDINVVVIGDHGVGKTSLIITFLSKIFPETVDDVCEVVTIPVDVNCKMIIRDTSSAPEKKNELKEALQKADVVILVYDMSVPNGIDSCKKYFTEMRIVLKAPIPVMLVGNKSDLTNHDNNQAGVEEKLIEFKEVECCLDCSAKTQQSIDDVFLQAHKVVMYPLGPLFDEQELKLKDGVEACLTRVFHLFDEDNDENLSDKELQTYHKTCFGEDLKREELDAVKGIMLQTGGINDGKTTLQGFLTLNSIFVQRGHQEMVWGVLRLFNYTNNFELSKECLCTDYPIPNDTICELNDKGYKFLEQLFKRSDKDNDGALSPRELDDFFKTTPGNPFTEEDYRSTVTTEKGYLPLVGFKAIWSKFTLVNTHETLKYLAYLGKSMVKNGASEAHSHIDKSSLVIEYIEQHSFRDRKYAKKINKVSRKVLSCYVLGTAGSGKSTLLDRFLKLQKDAPHRETKNKRLAINVTSNDRFLVLHDFGGKEEEVLNSKELMKGCDVMCFIYDVSNPQSFEYCEKIIRRSNVTPFVILANKTDTQEQLQTISPQDVCKELGVAAPLRVSLKNQDDNTEVFDRIVKAASKPQEAVPATSRLRRHKKTTWWNLLSVVAVGGSLVYLGYQYYKKKDTSKS